MQYKILKERKDIQYFYTGLSYHIYYIQLFTNKLSSIRQTQVVEHT